VSIRIVLAVDHRILREGLRSLLAQLPDVAVVGEAANGEAAIALARQFRPDLVLVDVIVPGTDGIAAIRRIHVGCPGTKVIALSMLTGRRVAAEMVRAGALGCLVQDSSFEELQQAIRTVMSDRLYLSAGIGRAEPAPVSLQMLTAREQEVLRLLAEGKRVKEVAHLLHISAKTVESHRQNIMDKLKIHSSIELARYALREGLTSI